MGLRPMIPVNGTNRFRMTGKGGSNPKATLADKPSETAGQKFRVETDWL